MNHFSVYSRGEKVLPEIYLRYFQTEEIGLFESLRTYRGKIFRKKEHLERFFESAKTSGFPKPPSYRMLSQELELALNAYQKDRKMKDSKIGKADDPQAPCEIFLRLTVTAHQIFVLVGERKHSEELYQKGVALKTSSVRRSLSNACMPETKTSAYQNAVLASLEIEAHQDYECVFLNQEGLITEVRIGNLFIVAEGSLAGTGKGLESAADFSSSSKRLPLLVTPPTVGILNGITRRVVIECALQSGIQVKEMPLMRHDVFNAREAFLTNTSWEILPIASLDGRPIRSRIPGPVTLELQNIFRRKVEDECL